MENQHSHISEDSIILAYTKKFIDEGPDSKRQFIIFSLLPALEKLGLVDSSPTGTETDKFIKWQDKHRRTILNIIAGTSKFPFSWKWVWINCLPERYRTPCKKELQALTGSLYVPMPEQTPHTMVSASCLPDIIREMSEVMRDSAPAQDGAFSPADDPEKTQLYADQVTDVVEACLRELVNIQMGTGVLPKRRLLAVMMTDLESSCST